VTSASRTSISDLPRGHELASSRFTISDAEVAAYLSAVGDETSYRQAIPPLAIVALALRSLQEQISLPDGALHTSQEVEQFAVARAGEPLTLTGRIAQRSERQGMVISVIEYEVAADGRTIVRARTTVIAPGAVS
jgi:hypothetical protein